jgi:hypothetical protein
MYSGKQRWPGLVKMNLRYKAVSSLVKSTYDYNIAVSVNTGSRKVKLSLTVTFMFIRIMIMEVTRRIVVYKYVMLDEFSCKKSYPSWLNSAFMNSLPRNPTFTVE